MKTENVDPMNTEQLKTDVAKFIISKGVDNRNIMGPSGYLQLDDLLTNFASQESKKAIDEVLIDKDFIVYCLNQAWNYAHEQLQKKDLGDIEREIYQQQKDKAKALMTKLDS